MYKRFMSMALAGLAIGATPISAQETTTTIFVVAITSDNTAMATGSGPYDAPKIYAVGGDNFCPSGLQPITISGVICCGTPNQSVSYQSMKAHPAPVRRARTVRRVVQSGYNCPVGEKGCYSN